MAATPSNLESTLYPKITTHISEIIEGLQALDRDPKHPEAPTLLAPIPIIGTAKLHGTHADILVHPNNTLTFQSRNLTSLTPSKDNAGFAAAMSSKTATLLHLRDLYLTRWSELNPTATLHQHHPVVIAGEWIGEKIQKDVAISQLSRRFVIVSVKVNGVWQNDQEYAGISLEADGIYNVSRAGLYHATLCPQDMARTITQVEELAEQVAARCPFAATFGLTGLGEGIVWKMACAKYNGDASLWFKTKGGVFKPKLFRAQQQSRMDDGVVVKRKAARAAAETWCSVQRLEQGWDVMREKGVRRDGSGAGVYVEWVKRDILVEEKRGIRDEGVDEEMLVVEIGKIARAWYKKRVRVEAGY
ncbi:DNA ligase mRNA capping enzyme catalytic [Pyrenophora tritici-repentis]|uniref:Atrophin-1 multi-domain protein n=2 Tax=Pyrenophora tritici-repentis TaxID=45151 RepID=A0A2W1GT72_9PLEO|nr:uncharacterized protein PTRG_09791 [Pyrenophora tritici-repentis Pt-1C-BFP]KAA8621841.1 hypothetical protein PtrV1_06342 [Pyrenophora tritici-repentis]EDU42842.1 predicted protein [Pyrenophora tritici-repentis Pt-1C-BFP]KAF7451061.1 hypothetical protein A1F99_056770 [Pyrenophora tritici-repentis]KAF7573744.1 Atrophin-1 multi-domain protein [Pyrenophora tritici-repentis]KAI1515986.1 hypothetical protein Ptr86124_004523 [Pyrenophora tritici-repentis]